MKGKEMVEELIDRVYEHAVLCEIGGFAQRPVMESQNQGIHRLSTAIADLIDAGVAHRCGTSGPCLIESALARCEAEMKPAETRDLGEHGTNRD